MTFDIPSQQSIKNQKKALSLVEIVTGAVILATAFGGVVATFSMAADHIGRSHRRMIAAHWAVDELGDLLNDIRQDVWNAGGNLTPGPHGAPPITWVVSVPGGSDFNGDGIEDYREVRITVGY